MTIALLVVLLITLSQEPHISPSVHPSYVYANSTAEVLFDYTPWLSHIALAMDKNCGAKLYQIQDKDCSTLPTLNTSYVDSGDQFDNIYMLPGSVIHFEINPATSGEIWVFSDHDTASKFGMASSTFDCFYPPPGALCFQAQKNPGRYSIIQPAYYCIRFIPSNLDVELHFNRIIFDIELITNDYRNIGTLTTDSTPISFPFPYKKSCILLHVLAGPSECHIGGGQVIATNVVRQEGYLIFPGMFLVICVITLIVLVGVHLYCHFRKSSSFHF